MTPVKLDCRECVRSYEFQASPGETARLTASCPECGGTDVRRGFQVLGGATGTYRYILTLGRTAKVSDWLSLRIKQ